MTRFSKGNSIYSHITHFFAGLHGQFEDAQFSSSQLRHQWWLLQQASRSCNTSGDGCSVLSLSEINIEESLTLDCTGCWLFTYTISILLEEVILEYFPISGGGAVPGFFFSPFKFAVICVPLTRTSQVGGNSIGHGSAFDLNEPIPA